MNQRDDLIHSRILGKLEVDFIIDAANKFRIV